MRTKKKQRIRITIKSSHTVFAEVMKKAKRLDKGLPVREAETELSFTDGATMLSTLSEKRMELLMHLHAQGPMNIKQLSKQLKRDYSNVHGDVKLLLRLGLLAKNKAQQVFVPWDELAIELPLAA